MKTLRWLVVFGLGVCAASAASWKEGDRVEAISYGAWAPGKVVAVDGERWKVTFDGFSSRFDEWVTADKIRALRKGGWKTGDRVEALSYGKWYPAKIIAAEEARWKVTYDGYGSGSDEWVDIDRLRPPGAKGEGATTAAGSAAASYTFPERPEGAKAGLQGAWLRVETFYWSGSLSLNNQGWFFTKDGRFSRSPAGGFDFKTFAAATEARKTEGVYWIEGDKLTLKWADGSKATEYAFKKKGDEIEFGGLGATPVEGFKKGWRLDGEYEGGASFGGGAIANSNTLVFRKDGTFARSSVASFKSTSGGSTVSGGSSGEAAGTYAFDGHTLTLTYADGTVKAHTVFAFGGEDGEGRPEYIYRDGTMMRNQETKRAAK